MARHESTKRPSLSRSRTVNPRDTSRPTARERRLLAASNRIDPAPSQPVSYTTGSSLSEATLQEQHHAFAPTSTAPHDSLTDPQGMSVLGTVFPPQSMSGPAGSSLSPVTSTHLVSGLIEPWNNVCLPFSNSSQPCLDSSILHDVAKMLPQATLAELCQIQNLVESHINSMAQLVCTSQPGPAIWDTSNLLTASFTPANPQTDESAENPWSPSTMINFWPDPCIIPEGL